MFKSEVQINILLRISLNPSELKERKVERYEFGPHEAQSKQCFICNYTYSKVSI